MISRARRSFWEAFARLPTEVQRVARAKFALWRDDPFHTSLQFKEVSEGLWSVRISSQYRALALREGEIVLWLWIGPHGKYDRLI